MNLPLIPRRIARVPLPTLLAYAAFHGFGYAAMFVNETIGVNFTGNPAVPGLTVDQTTGVLLQADWNNIAFAPSVITTLTTGPLSFDNSTPGTYGTSAVTLSVTAGSAGRSNTVGGATTAKTLLNGILIANATAPDLTFAFNGLSAGNYQAILYTEYNAAGATYSATLGGVTYYQTAQQGAAVNNTTPFVQGTNTTPGLATPPTANNVQFASTTIVGGTMNVGFHWTGGSTGAGVAGIQLKLLQLINVWSGSVNGNWDVNTTSNWNGNGAAAKFQNSDYVSFGDVDATPGSPVPVANRTITVTGGGVTAGNILINNSTGDYTFGGGSINGAGSVTKSGLSALTFNHTNGYTGGTVVTGGAVRLGAVNALGLGGNLALGTGTTLDLNSNSQTVGALTGAGTVTNASAAATGTLTVGSGAVMVPFGDVAAGGRIIDGAGAVALVKNTAGTLALKGANAYSGGTTVGGGTLSIGHVWVVAPEVVEICASIVSTKNPNSRIYFITKTAVSFSYFG